MFSLISKPVFITTPDKVTIQFFFLLLKVKLRKKNNSSLLILENFNKLKIVCNILTRLFKKPIEIELVRLYYPYYNSKILVNLFGIFLNKIKLRRIVKNFISKSIKNKNYQLVPSALSGIKIKIAGRLLTQRVIPRKTVKFINSGSISRGKTMFVETARFTSKNKRGAFSLTVSIGHKVINTNGFNNNQIRSFQTSAVNYGLTKLERDILYLETKVSDILVGLLLEGLNRINPLLRFRQSTKNEGYLLHLFNLFKKFCSMTEPKVYNLKPNKLTGKYYNAIFFFYTRSLPIFNKFYSLFYNEGKKKGYIIKHWGIVNSNWLSLLKYGRRS